ncbi:MAG: hypothetical protein JW880_01520 [Candidatus Thermoplasmatota archaeon]|nr:hypothetical protein [Candidatus Thermoplasmatota archaeon]
MADEKPEEKGKAEAAAEKTGEAIGKGVKKGFGVVKAFGKGTKDALTDKDKKKEG